MFERFTDSARQCVVSAEEEARRMQAGHIGTEHLLIAVARDRQGLGGRLLRELGVTPDALREDAGRLAEPAAIDSDALATLGIDLDEVKRRVEETFGPGALARGRAAKGRIPFAPDTKKALELSLRSALALDDKFIGSEHILLGLARTGEYLLVDCHLDATRIEAAIQDARRAA